MLPDFLFPQHNVCHLCERYLSVPALLCPACEANLRSLRLRTPLCQHPPLSACVSVFEHDYEARELVHRLKYASDCALSAVLGEPMACAVPLLGPVDAAVPVPMHPARQRRRGYNQAEKLAEVVCARTALPLESGLLIRSSKTKSQVGKTREERLSAMRNVFAVPDPQRVIGRHILLVDDVLTTGATAVSCAEALLAAGAQSVQLLTACRA